MKKDKLINLMTRKNTRGQIAIGWNRKKDSEGRTLSFFIWLCNESSNNALCGFMSVTCMRAKNLIEIGSMRKEKTGIERCKNLLDLLQF